MVRLLQKVAEHPVVGLARLEIEMKRIVGAVLDQRVVQGAALERTVVHRHHRRAALRRAVTPATRRRAQIGHRLARLRLGAKHDEGFFHFQITPRRRRIVVGHPALSVHKRLAGHKHAPEICKPHKQTPRLAPPSRQIGHRELRHPREPFFELLVEFFFHAAHPPPESHELSRPAHHARPSRVDAFAAQTRQ